MDDIYSYKLDSFETVVSVIIPTYNRVKFITKAMDSVWEQTYRPIELLVIDDGSTDHTKDVVEKWKKRHFSEDFIINYIFQENKGAPAARNNGIRNAIGGYLQFLDSDDLLMSQKIKLQIRKIRKEGVVMCTCNTLIVNEYGATLDKRDFNITFNRVFRKALSIHSPVPLIEKAFLENKGIIWNERLSKAQDKDFFLKVLMLIDYKSHIDKFLFKWVWHSEERIGNVKNGIKVHWALFKSVLNFTKAHWTEIPMERRCSVLILQLRLLYASTWIRTIIRLIKSGGKEFPT